MDDAEMLLLMREMEQRKGTTMDNMSYAEHARRLSDSELSATIAAYAAEQRRRRIEQPSYFDVCAIEGGDRPAAMPRVIVPEAECPKCKRRGLPKTIDSVLWFYCPTCNHYFSQGESERGRMDSEAL